MDVRGFRRGRIRIVSRPEGEAPEWVREAWIGLELPLRHGEVLETRTQGVLTAQRSYLGFWWRVLTRKAPVVTGYLVDAKVAIEHLEARSPEAAQWWRTHCAYLLKPGQGLIFDVPACERLDVKSSGS